MRKPTLLGYILTLPYGYTLMGDNSERNHHQLVSHSQEQLRVLEQSGVFLEQFFRQGSKIILSQTADEERAAENVIDIPCLVPQGPVSAVRNSWPI